MVIKLKGKNDQACSMMGRNGINLHKKFYLHNWLADITWEISKEKIKTDLKENKYENVN
jgi:hypothetical protein